MGSTGESRREKISPPYSRSWKVRGNGKDGDLKYSMGHRNIIKGKNGVEETLPKNEER